MAAPLQNKEGAIEMKKRILALALSAAMALSLAACSNGGDASGSGSGSGSGSSSGGSTGAQKVGIAMPTQSLERWNRDGSYLDEQFKSAGYETILTYSDNDINRQVNDIQNMIAEDVDLLVIAAIDGEALNTVMNEAGQAGIPVIAYDRLIMNDNASYYVSFDNYTVGTLQGQYIVDTLDLDNAAGPFNMEITAGDPADNNATYFYQGAVDVLQPYIDSGKLVVVSGQTDFDTVATAQWDSQTAMERAQNVLASYYADGTQVDVWLCSNDSTALGVSQAIQSDYAGSNQPIITGQDGDTIDANLITDSGWAFDCTYDTESYFTSDGHNCPSFLLVPNVVTTDNMVEKLVDTGYYTQDADGYLHPAA